MISVVTALAAVGAIALLILSIRIVLYTFHYFISAYSYKAYKNEWAVVTGASAGIGAGFVRQLAARGVNVVLLARSKDKMDQIAQEVSQAHSVKTQVIPFDFGTASTEEYASLASQLTPLSPKILVNNVGVNVEFPTEFLDMQSQDIDRIVHINISSINRMTAMLLPAMISAKKGIVFCLSSGGGCVAPAPLLAPYAGTKAYANAFAVALSGEVASAGVIVQSLTPFFVESAMAKMRKSFTVPSAEDFADKALKQVGASPSISPHWVHYILQLGLTALPLKIQTAYVTNLHRKIRARAIRRKERLAKKN